MNDCIFCRIVKGEIPCSKIYEDDEFIAFLDINPVNKGHALVVPKEHSTNIFDMLDETASKMMVVAKKIATAIKKATNADGINITMNNGKAAGQLIMHPHLHIIPRFEGDGFKHWHGEEKPSDAEMDEIKENIKSELSN